MSTQITLFDVMFFEATGELPKFGGATVEACDVPRLAQHLANFIAYVQDRREHTLGEIAGALKMSQCSASARWRDLKKLGYTYEKRRDEKIDGLWHYRLTGEPNQ